MKEINPSHDSFKMPWRQSSFFFWLGQEQDNEAVVRVLFFIKARNRQKDSSLLDLAAMYYVKDE